MKRSTRLIRLLEAQRRIHGIEAGMLAARRVGLCAAEGDLARLIDNASGGNPAIAASLVLSVSSAARAAMHVAELSRAVELQSEKVVREGLLERQLEHMIDKQRAGEEHRVQSAVLAELQDRPGSRPKGRTG